MTSVRSAPARFDRLGHAEIFAVLFALSFLAARFLPVAELGMPCPFKVLTGFPCATCGMTHAFVRLARGDLLGALTASPLGTLVAAGCWLFAVANVLRLLFALPLPSLGAETARRCALVGFAALLANWAFLVLVYR